MKFRDVELLSEYLDGRLSPSDAARLEARLASDASLKGALNDMRETRGLIRRLPQRRAPRNFRLTPKMAGVRPPAPRAYPAFRFATALAMFLFLASVALNAFTPFAAQRFAPVAAPALGKGGGAGGGGPAESSEAAPAATPAPLQQPFAAVAPTPTAESPAAADLATAQAVQTQDALRPAPTTEANQAAPVSPPNPLPASPQPVPVPVPWVIGLGVVMIVCAAAAWLLRLNNERRIRNRWNQK